mgnify:CR=1 FL=1
MISRMKWAAGRKLRANTGETLTEVLISVLVIALGMTMFSECISGVRQDAAAGRRADGELL